MSRRAGCSTRHGDQRRKDIDRFPQVTDAQVLVGRVLVVVEVGERQADRRKTAARR